MDDDDTVLFAVLAALGGLVILSLIFVGVGGALLLAWSMSDRLGAPAAMAEVVTATALPAAATVQLSPTAVSLALPLVAAPSELTPTPTFVPSVAPTAAPIAMLPTIVPEPVVGSLPTVVAAPTPTVAPPLPSDTPFPSPAPSPTAMATPVPTATLTGWWVERNGIVFASSCACDQGDTLNCGNFPRAQDAQACYLRCQELTGTDVHELDRDKDGSACEWNW